MPRLVGALFVALRKAGSLSPGRRGPGNHSISHYPWITRAAAAGLRRAQFSHFCVTYFLGGPDLHFLMEVVYRLLRCPFRVPQVASLSELSRINADSKVR